tara:strand:- start:792 stop:995 length:204 start_codon:yes stop_codon:yes gene_type:complete
MSKKQEGPFKRKLGKRKKNFSIHAPWAGAALALIVITQVPTAIKATLEITCIAKASNDSNISWCKDL